MKLQISKNASVNYLAKIIRINKFSNHPNPEVTRMKVAHIDGYSICVGIDEQPGLYVYFPTLSQLNPNLLEYLNLYSDKELNRNPEQRPGFFSSNGRVRAIKLKGLLSEGFLLPFSSLQDWIMYSVNIELPEQNDGIEFDEVEHNGKTFWVNKKYIVPVKSVNVNNSNSKYDKNIKKFNRIRDDQFHFHYDTMLIKKCPNVIRPDDIIHISSKWHGTSAISAYILCHKELTWKEKIAKWLTGESFDTYDYVYASRSVIKNKYFNKEVSGGYYNCDVWAEADKVLRPFIEKGMTLYYEIVGFLPTGSYIQKNYDYGCTPSTTSYVEGVNYKIYIYRITTTNIEGKVHEWSTHEVQLWCSKNGLRPVTEFYYGYAKDLYKDLVIDDNWTGEFLKRLSDDKNFFMEKNSPDCINKVPHEGIVIKKENMVSEAFKLKCFKFISKEQDAADSGETNIEDSI